MPKIPKIDELANNMPGMINKFKSILNTATANMKASEPIVIAPTGDPIRDTLAEIDAIATQLKEMQTQQARLLTDIKTRIAAMNTQLIELAAKNAGEETTAQAATVAENPVAAAEESATTATNPAPAAAPDSPAKPQE